jgi:hypothetical protein
VKKASSLPRRSLALSSLLQAAFGFAASQDPRAPERSQMGEQRPASVAVQEPLGVRWSNLGLCDDLFCRAFEEAKKLNAIVDSKAKLSLEDTIDVARGLNSTIESTTSAISAFTSSLEDRLRKGE